MSPPGESVARDVLLKRQLPAGIDSKTSACVLTCPDSWYFLLWRQAGRERGTFSLRLEETWGPTALLSGKLIQDQ